MLLDELLEMFKKRSSGNSGRFRSRLLFPLVCSNKEIRGMEACHKFKETKPTDSVPPFQDGDGTIDKVSATNRRMGGLGRLLSDAYYHLLVHPKVRKFPRVHVLGTTFQFKAMCFGLCTAPLNLHTSHESNCSFPQGKVNSDTHVSRRLADPGTRPGEISFRRSNGPESSLRVRLSDQQEKVRVKANSVVQIPGDVNKPEDRSGFDHLWRIARKSELGVVTCGSIARSQQEVISVFWES